MVDAPLGPAGDRYDPMVGSPEAVEHRPTLHAAPTPAKARILDAAQKLFARHGVGGTSLQMIADELGVTKAAVYHQYAQKDQIVLAAAESELARVESVIARAEAERTTRQTRQELLTGIVELAVERRHTVGGFLTDPQVTGYFIDHPPFRDIMGRLRAGLVGDDDRPEANVQVAMLIAAISGAVTNPFVVDLPDETLRDQLLLLARRFLRAPA